jgi:hypothetical protein
LVRRLGAVIAYQQPGRVYQSKAAASVHILCMKTALMALATLAALGTVAQAQTSTYERTCSPGRNGATRCTTISESPGHYSEMECVHGRGGSMQCTTNERESRIPEPSIEHVQRNGKTINVMRGMPDR